MLNIIAYILIAAPFVGIAFVILAHLAGYDNDDDKY